MALRSAILLLTMGEISLIESEDDFGHCIARPEEIAQAYIYLMKCTYVTGQVLQVDGGGRLSG